MSFGTGSIERGQWWIQKYAIVAIGHGYNPSMARRFRYISNHVGTHIAVTHTD